MRRTTLVLTQRDVERLVDMRSAIRLIRDSFKALARGQAVMPPKLYLPLPGGNDPSTRAQGRPSTFTMSRWGPRSFAGPGVGASAVTWRSSDDNVV